MKIKRKVSEKVIAANQRNGKQGKGPRSQRGKRISSMNARRHGLLAKTLIFASDEEEAAYNEFLQQMIRDKKPRDMEDFLYVKQAVDMTWKLNRAERWEEQSVRAVRRSAPSVVRALAADSGNNILGPDLSLVTDASFTDSLAGWECQEISLWSRHTTGAAPSGPAVAGGKEQANDHVSVHAKLGNSLQNAMRYGSMARRDRDRAFDRLRRNKAATNRGEKRSRTRRLRVACQSSGP